jgi:hypothetical protein
MKFYRDIDNNIYNDYWNKIYYNKLTAIHCDSIAIRFFKNGIKNNNKNASYISNSGKVFWLNNKSYGYGNNFTKESWRRFVKLQAFL